MAESVYDLLPKELQLQPSSTQTDPPTMSQNSGGEAGPPPSAALASGELPAQSMKTMIWDQFLCNKLLPKSAGVKKCGLVWVTGGNFTLSSVSEARFVTKGDLYRLVCIKYFKTADMTIHGYCVSAGPHVIQGYSTNKSVGGHF